ncbi:hypothetical protein HK104_003806, partial [Borealophlyctis nickersoniae]
MSAFPAARKVTPDELELIRQMSKAGSAPKTILATLRQQNPQTHVISRDISNIKARLRGEERNGRTPYSFANAVIQLLAQHEALPPHQQRLLEEQVAGLSQQTLAPVQNPVA